MFPVLKSCFKNVGFLALVFSDFSIVFYNSPYGVIICFAQLLALRNELIQKLSVDDSFFHFKADATKIFGTFRCNIEKFRYNIGKFKYSLHSERQRHLYLRFT